MPKESDNLGGWTVRKLQDEDIIVFNGPCIVRIQKGEKVVKALLRAPDATRYVVISKEDADEIEARIGKSPTIKQYMKEAKK